MPSAISCSPAPSCSGGGCPARRAPAAGDGLKQGSDTHALSAVVAEDGSALGCASVGLKKGGMEFVRSVVRGGGAENGIALAHAMKDRLDLDAPSSVALRAAGRDSLVWSSCGLFRSSRFSAVSDADPAVKNTIQIQKFVWRYSETADRQGCTLQL